MWSAFRPVGIQAASRSYKLMVLYQSVIIIIIFLLFILLLLISLLLLSLTKCTYFVCPTLVSPFSCADGKLFSLCILEVAVGYLGHVKKI